MAKNSGSTRASQWSGGLYNFGGRREYTYLPVRMQKAILKEYKSIAKVLNRNIGQTKVTKDIGEGKKVEIVFTKNGLDHFCRDAMVVLSGKYFSKASMLNIKEIFSKSVFIKGKQPSYHEKKPNELYFKYADIDGRGVYFKAKKNEAGLYVFYSVVDK